MRVAFVNPQGNFDRQTCCLASHPGSGGQLVYVREVARMLGGMDHRVTDPDWPEFGAPAPTRRPEREDTARALPGRAAAPARPGAELVTSGPR